MYNSLFKELTSFTKLFRRFVSALSGKGLKDVFSFQNFSEGNKTLCRRHHTARELRVERACAISFTCLRLGLPGGLFPAGPPHQNPVLIYIPPYMSPWPASIIFHFMLTSLYGDINIMKLLIKQCSVNSTVSSCNNIICLNYLLFMDWGDSASARPSNANTNKWKLQLRRPTTRSGPKRNQQVYAQHQQKEAGGSSAVTVTTQYAEHPRNRGSISGKSKTFSPLQKRVDRLRGPPGLQINGCNDKVTGD
jgi:hypothetical protein